MAFFTSEYSCKLDAKGRLVLPARMKSNLPDIGSEELFMRQGFEPCLELYPLVEYKKIYSKIAGLNEFNAEYRRLQRNFFRGSTTVELDGSGRLLVPKSMLQYAQLDKNVIVVGMGNRMEIWNPDVYAKYVIQDPHELSELAQKHLTESD